jgi:hypothetical protein
VKESNQEKINTGRKSQTGALVTALTEKWFFKKEPCALKSSCARLGEQKKKILAVHSVKNKLKRTERVAQQI